MAWLTVVAVRPSSSPALARMKAPVQTDMTWPDRSALSCTHLISRGLLTA
jgi:hypothetical protein